MAYNTELAARVLAVIGKRKPFEERSMFGGLAIMIDGKMAIGINQDDLMVRVGPDLHDEALADRGARPMDFTGRPMRGFVYVGPAGTKTPADLDRWIDRALAFNAIAPASRPKRRK